MVIKGLKNFVSHIESNQFPHTICVISNGHLGNKIIEIARNKLNIEEITITVEKDIGELSNKLSTSSLFFSKTLYIVKNFESINKKDRKNLYDSILKPKEGRYIIILLPNNFDSREIPKWMEIVKDLNDINDIIKEKEYEYNVKLSPYIKSMLIELVGSSHFMIDKIFEKLSLINKEYINEEEDIIGVIGDSGQRQLYELTNSIVEKDLEKSLKILHNLRNWGIDEYTLISMIRSLWIRIFLIYVLTKEGITYDKVANIINRKSWYVKKTLNHLSEKRVTEGMKIIYETERMIRMSMRKEYLLENLVRELSIIL